MSEYATKGAMLTCTCGSAPSQLGTTSNTLLSVQGNNVATTSDKGPMANIKPFGTCSLKPSPSGPLPCMPSPLAWMGFLTSVEIPGGNPLLMTSKIMCALGGNIAFQNSGQMKPSKVVINPTSPQIEALKQAAKNATPFCEECEKKKREMQPKILRIYWVDENKEKWDIGTLFPGQAVTLCVDVEGIEAGETVDVKIEAQEGKLFKGNKRSLAFSPTVEDDGAAYIDEFVMEYEKQ